MRKISQLFDYLSARRLLHGRVKTGDELNFAGYFLQYGGLAFEDGTMVDDSFSNYFDDAWYEDQGLPRQSKFEEKPFESVIEKRRNKIILRNRSTNEVMDEFVVPPGALGYSPLKQEDLKGRNRNKVCFCGSGKKFKKCHGLE